MKLMNLIYHAILPILKMLKVRHDIKEDLYQFSLFSVLHEGKM